MSWHLGPLAGFDLETSGIDVDTDRIVTGCVVHCGGGQPVRSTVWMADPGVEIPAEAAAVHGITTERARAEGRPAAEVVAEIVDALEAVACAGVPIVTMNGSFDLTMLEREAERYGVKGLFARTTPLVIDVRVLDKHVDRYRRGSRTLAALCEHYKVDLDGAHSADADALAACRVAWRIGSMYGGLAGLTSPKLHAAQVEWAAAQAEELRGYFARTPGKEHLAASVRTDWPYAPRTAPDDGERGR